MDKDKNNIEASEDWFIKTLKAAMNMPGVRIKRTDFLHKELSKRYPDQVVELAISKNPAYAGIYVSDIDKIAKSCIGIETKRVTAISTGAGIPGGLLMIGTVPADLAQYFAHIVRVLQKLVYLYGWKELYNADGEFDDETESQLTLFIGVMFGVQAANSTVAKIAQKAAVQVEKDLVKKPLTQGVIYPIVKKIARILGYKMTKDVFAKGVGKLVPVLGGIISGTLTFATFTPAANNLKNHLNQLPMADVEFYKETHDGIEEVEFSDVDFNEIELIIKAEPDFI